MDRRPATALLMWLLLLLCPPLLQATNGMFPLFMGGRAAGRGGVDFAIANDATAINTNPAGIGFIRGKMFDFTIGAFFPRVSFENAINGKIHSDFEPIPFGSFAMVWDTPGQALDMVSDPIVYLFDTPTHSDYLLLSAGRPYPLPQASRNKGEGVLEAQVQQFQPGLTLMAYGRGATISDIRVYGYSQPAPTRKVLFSCDRLPDLPAYCVVTSIAARFEWRGSSKRQALTLRLQAETEQEVVKFTASGHGWQQGYLALVWEKDRLPANIELTVPADGDFQVRNLKVTIGYRLEKTYYWQQLHQNNHTVAIQKARYCLLATDQRRHRIDSGDHPRRLTLPQSIPLPHGQQLSQIKVYYHYQLDRKVSNRFLRVALHQDGQVLDTVCHQKAYTSPGESVPICRRQADQEMPAPDRGSGFKFGFGVFPQAGAKYTINVKTDDLFPEGIENRVDMMFVSVAPALAYRVADRFSIGIALNFNYSRMEMDGLISQSVNLLAGRPIEGESLTFGEFLRSDRGIDNVRGEVDSDYLEAFGVGGRIGFMWKVSDRLHIGAVYSPKTWMTVSKGKATVDFTRHFQDPQLVDITTIARLILPNNARYGFINHYDMELTMNLPQRAGVGLSYLVLDNLLLSADFQWIDYSDTQYHIDMDLRNGDNIDFNTLAGSTDIEPVLRLGWKDQYVIAVGIVWQPSSQWILRAGYNYGNNPIPKEYLNPQMAAISEHHLTFGASYMINRNITIHAAVECALPSRLRSGAVNVAHEKFADSELSFYSIDAVLGVSVYF